MCLQPVRVYIYTPEQMSQIMIFQKISRIFWKQLKNSETITGITYQKPFIKPVVFAIFWKGNKEFQNYHAFSRLCCPAAREIAFVYIYTFAWRLQIIDFQEIAWKFWKDHWNHSSKTLYKTCGICNILAWRVISTHNNGSPDPSTPLFGRIYIHERAAGTYGIPIYARNALTYIYTPYWWFWEVRCIIIMRAYDPSGQNIVNTTGFIKGFWWVIPVIFSEISRYFLEINDLEPSPKRIYIYIYIYIR